MAAVLALQVQLARPGPPAAQVQLARAARMALLGHKAVVVLPAPLALQAQAALQAHKAQLALAAPVLPGLPALPALRDLRALPARQVRPGPLAVVSFGGVRGMGLLHTK